MDFEFTEEQKAWREEIRRFIKENATPGLYEEIREAGGETSSGPETRAWTKKLVEKGYYGVGWPKEYGGQGKGAIEQWMLQDELAYAGLPGGGTGLTMMGPTIMRVASDEMKKEYLPRILKGEIRFALGYSEPDAGSDLARLDCRAVMDGDEIVINGQKIWNTGAHTCTHEWLAVRTDPNVPRHKGISVVIVPLDSRGITIKPTYTWAGVRTNQVFFDDVRVPRKNLVGEANQGWYYIVSALDFERVAVGNNGDLRRLFEEFRAFLKETKINGQCLAEDPVIATKLASIAIDLQACRLLSLRNAVMIDKGQIPNAEASMVKVFNSELKVRMGDLGMQILGLYGQLKTESKWAPLAGRIEKLYRMGPVHCFWGGTNEIQRDIIARRGLRLG